jgi:hypothetical protein
MLYQQATFSKKPTRSPQHPLRPPGSTFPVVVVVVARTVDAYMKERRGWGPAALDMEVDAWDARACRGIYRPAFVVLFGRVQFAAFLMCIFSPAISCNFVIRHPLQASHMVSSPIGT